MKKQKWPISSDQLELLIAFSSADSLQGLADFLAKDVSVVSRNLQRLAEDSPVITKIKGKWQITEIGEKTVQLAKHFLSDLLIVLGKEQAAATDQLSFSQTALLVINAQQGLIDKNGAVDQTKVGILTLLNLWRARSASVIHVPHRSENSESKFYIDAPGSSFISELGPTGRELVIPKLKSSGFSDTKLAETLSSLDIQTVVLTGFTAGECIASTARDGADLGFDVIVVSDGTCSFDLFGPSGELHKAEKVHASTLANLHNFFAKVMTVAELKTAVK